MRQITEGRCKARIPVLGSLGFPLHLDTISNTSQFSALELPVCTMEDTNNQAA
jgi:hypothetical protein